ncbi:unnamed protein product [Linum trigynum]|uniref:Leucine-rich repeat-containing N-terminal plant-type domain-containing protein n=1 Tax=Linum trigynum TaxID=586398 RepID=A0AAV2CSW1_9ROSI
MSVGRSKACYYGRFITGFVWVMALFTVPEWKICDGCWEQERTSLLHLKASLSNPPYMNSWSSNEYCCYWDGVGCDPVTGKVTKLALGYPYNNSARAMPAIHASLFLPFQELRVLSLKGYHIPGCIENQGWPNLKRLSIYDSFISCNNFLETVATVMTNLTQLMILDSGLISTIPQALCTVMSLRVLDLSANHLMVPTRYKVWEPRI